MKAFVLAAGEGRRMLPLTLEVPKPLLTVQGKSLLGYHLLSLAQAGFKDVVVNAAYLGEQIEQFVGDGARWGLNIQCSKEPEPLETGGAIQYARTLLGDDPFVLINGDTFTDFSFSKLMNIRDMQGQLAHLILVDNPRHNPDGDFAFLADKHKVKYKGENGLTFAGISIINPLQFDEFDTAEASFPLRDLLKWGCENQQVSAEYFNGNWADVGTPERLEKLNAAFE